uniref:Sulfate permease family protein 3 n=1 Tax=Ascaris suum TaxID=6253 RepID=F1L6E5_ASCSU
MSATAIRNELPSHIAPLRGDFMRQEDFDELYMFLPPPEVEDKKRKFLYKFFHPCLGPEQFFRFLVSFVPIIEWLPQYSWKRNLLGDFMAGITVGIMHVPQGIAYAILQGIDPVYGLYSSFFPALFYMIFGTSDHVSIGSFAIISLMTGTSRAKILTTIHDEYLHDEGYYVEHVALLGYTSLDIRNITADVPFHLSNVSGIEVVSALTLCVGLVHLLMALLRVEFLTSYLSDQLISGFSTGASVHVIIVQLDKIFQVYVESVDGPGGILVQFVDVISKIGEMNVFTFLFSIGAFIFLYIGKDCINPLLRKKIPMILPFELMLVCLATLLSYLFDFDSKHHVKVVGSVPVGFPSAELPRLQLIPYVYKDAFEIAFVIVAVHLSMCKIFCRRHNYSTDNNQELYAIGLTGVISSCFLTYPVSSALARSMLVEESGGKTQLSALFSSLLILIVILWLSPISSFSSNVYFGRNIDIFNEKYFL